MSNRGRLCGAALFLSVTLVGLLLARRSPESYDAQIMYQVTQSLVDHGTFSVHHDPFAINTPYSYYGIWMSVLMAVPYWAAEHLQQDPGPWVMSVNSVVVGTIAVVVFALSTSIGATMRQSVVASGLTVFGTLLLPYATTGFSEPSVGFAIALGLLGVQTRRPTLTGVAAGLSLLMRVDSALLVALPFAVATWFANGRAWAPIFRFAVGALPSVLVVGAYDTVRFGAPWRTGYGFATFDHPLLAGLYGLLLSPAAGLLLYVPLVLPALVGLVATTRGTPVLAWTAMTLIAIRIPFYAVWFGWSAYWAWGPRYLVPAMPALAVGLIEICKRWSGLQFAVKATVGAVAALSFSVQVVGAAVGYEHATMFAALLRAHPAVLGSGFIADEAAPSTQAVWDRIEFDWSKWPIPDESIDLLKGRYLSGRWMSPAPNVPALGLLALAATMCGAAAVRLSANGLVARRA